MTPKEFAALAATATVSLIAAIAVYAARAPGTGEAAASGKLLPNLESDAGKVARIRVTQGGKPLTIARNGDLWLVESQDGYPASSEKVRTLVTALADAKLLEPKTKVPARYALLEVDDPAGPNSNARLIQLEDASGNPLAEVIAGKQRPAPADAAASVAKNRQATYVRRPGDDQSWLASTSIGGGGALKDWTDARVLETPGGKVKELTVTVAGEAPYKIKRNADGNHELDAIPAGKKIKYVNMIDNIVEAASFVDFERVRKAPGTPGGEAGSVSFETDDGLKVTLKVRRDKDTVWLSIEPSGEGEAKKAADEIKARTAAWEFAVLPSKADTMLKKEADLLEDIASAESSESTTPGGLPGMPPGMPGIPGMPPALPTP